MEVPLSKDINLQAIDSLDDCKNNNNNIYEEIEHQDLKEEILKTEKISTKIRLNGGPETNIKSYNVTVKNKSTAPNSALPKPIGCLTNQKSSSTRIKKSFVSEKNTNSLTRLPTAVLRESKVVNSNLLSTKPKKTTNNASSIIRMTKPTASKDLLTKYPVRITSKNVVKTRKISDHVPSKYSSSVPLKVPIATTGSLKRNTTASNTKKSIADNAVGRNRKPDIRSSYARISNPVYNLRGVSSSNTKLKSNLNSSRADVADDRPRTHSVSQAKGIPSRRPDSRPTTVSQREPDRRKKQSDSERLLLSRSNKSNGSSRLKSSGDKTTAELAKNRNLRLVDKQKISKEERKKIEETKRKIEEKREKKKLQRNKDDSKSKEKDDLYETIKPSPQTVAFPPATEENPKETTGTYPTVDNGNTLIENANSSTDIDIEDITMVWQNGGTRLMSKTSPLKPIRSQPYDDSIDKIAQEKRDRIQRYKEERRKQMAARYGTIEPSSSDEENVNNNSTFRRKRRQRAGLDSSSTDLSTGENRKARENGSCGDLRNRRSKEVSSSEDKKHSKKLSPLGIFTSSDVRHHDENIGIFKTDTLSDHSFNRLQSQEGRRDSADSPLSGSDGRGSRRRTSTEERDKSYKRKSHLNRASTSEEAVYPLPPSIAQLSDSSEDVPRRRRRRTPAGTCDLLSSSDANLCRSSILEAKKSQVLLPPTPLSPLRSPSLLVSSQLSLAGAGSQSAPSTLDARSNSCLLNKDELKSSHKYNSLKATPLKKPEIPEILKHKEPGLTSPGVLFPANTDSRPSSVVFEKPPVAPEGLVRVPSVRSSLKKNSESGGTCFMASRREKREDDNKTNNDKNEFESTGIKRQIDSLTAEALDLTSRVQALSEDSMVQECETYLNSNKNNIPTKKTCKDIPMKTESLTPSAGIPLSANKGMTSDTGQKNWSGGPEANVEKVIRRLVFEEGVKQKIFSSNSTASSGPPDTESLSSRRQNVPEDTESPPRMQSPSDPVQSILIRRSSREDSVLSSSSDKSGILKRKSSCPKVNSLELVEGDPRPILKKRSSVDDDYADRKSILKKKSLTDDELDSDRPKSILKGARSREEIPDRSDKGSPTPILKRYSKGDLEGDIGELRPILKRRDTSDSVPIQSTDAEELDASSTRDRIESASDTRTQSRSHSPSLPGAIPSHGILKRRSHTDQSDNDLGIVLRQRVSLDVDENTTTGERPLSVAERIAGMEALQGKTVLTSPSSSPGTKPKIRTSSEERNSFLSSSERESRRDSYSSPSKEQISEPTEAFNPLFTPSKVSQRAAFFAMLEQEKVDGPKKDSRVARFSTQPVTEGEVTEASQMQATSSLSTSEKEPSINVKELGVRSDSNVGAKVALWSKRLQELQSKSIQEPERRRAARFRTQPITLAEVQRASALNSTGNGAQAKTLMNAVTSDTNKRSSIDGHLVRRFSTLDLMEDNSSQGDSIRGILKNDHTRDRSKDSPRSILKSDSRKSSISESEHPKGILKSDSPLTSTVASPEHDGRKLRSVLKKDSSFEDGREIKSILKPESESLEPEFSSDSSSEINHSQENTSVDYTDYSAKCSALEEAYNAVITAGDYAEFCRKSRSSVKKSLMKEAVKQAQPMKAKDNLAEALRQIEPLRRSKSRESNERRRDEDSSLYTNREEDNLFMREERSSAKEERLSSKSKEEFVSSSNCKEEVVIDEMKASFEENMKAISDLSQEERVTFRQKRHSFNQKHHERWTFNEFTSPLKSSQSESSSSSSSSSSTNSSPNAGLPPTPPVIGKTNSPPERMSSPLEIMPSRITDVSEPDGGFFTHSPARSSINERLAALQRNGEEGWRSRVSKKEGEKEIEHLSSKNGRSKARPTSLLDRVSLLETSSQQWKGRVSQSDATKFTVAHKMASASSVPSLIAEEAASPFASTGIPSPASERKKRIPQPKVFKSKTGSSIPDLIEKKTQDSARSLAQEFSRSLSTSQEESFSVSIPRPDDDSFNDFFTTSSSLSESSQKISISLSDFDHISSNTEQLVVHRKNVRVIRKNQTIGNPLKSLAAREDVKNEYSEVKLGMGEKELRRMKVEELSKSSSLAVEALAGLASKENFSAVALKKVEQNPVIRELSPYNDLMLFQVKGRRHPQVRLVEPSYRSINSGDDFILLTPTELFHYKGHYTNVIERAVASEIVLYILQTKDMGIANIFRITDVEDTSPDSKRERFWSKLGGSSSSRPTSPGGPDSDDDYEAAIVASNKVFEVQGDALSPVKEAWGHSPKYELLQPEKVLVFDFGSEVYFWAGKRAPLQDKKRGLRLLKELWSEEYDYSDCDINPIEPSSSNSMKGHRPSWGICGKITENVETILFKEKFVDWPDTAQQTRIKELRKEVDLKPDAMDELEPCDVDLLIENRPEDPDLVLEMSHLGRGVQYYDEEERRLHNISTSEVKVWHISENEKKLLDECSSINFYDDETYVVRWFYHVTATGRTLMGTPSKHNVTGRYRVAYFFWQGINSSVSDKGVSALMTVELDEERGPHKRVTMGYEPPVFLNLFDGKFVIHNGQRHSIKAQWRLFIVRANCENEGHLMQVDVNASHLRSNGCFVLINTSAGIVYLWKGSRASSNTKMVAIKTAQLLRENSSEELGWKTTKVLLKEESEGSESKDFLNGIGMSSYISKLPYYSHLNSNSYAEVTPRIWRIDPLPQYLKAHELVSSYRLPNTQSPFPIWQEELYSASQPALFMVDAGYKVFVWQGWWPDEVIDQEESSSCTTGSAFLRFIFARRALLQTVLNYVKHKKITLNMKEEPEIVLAGIEPLEFTSLFPMWRTHSLVAEVQEKEGRWKKGTKYLVKDVYKQLCRNRFSLEELTSRPLPDGADPSRLEKYLSDEDFQNTLGMDRIAFQNLASWKKLKMKKNANLF